MACELNEILPRDLEPTHYRIKIIPNLKTLDISGVVRITFIVKNETNKIIFNLSNIIIVEESVKITQKENSKSIEIKSQNYMECCLYEIALNNPLKVEEEYFLDLAYSGELNKSLQGFYKMTYLDNFDDVRTGASTQFSPTDARKAFPCFDEPHFKATFRISIARPSDMKTLSNMILEKSEPIIGSDNYVWDHYPETPKMPTYIVGFMITTLKTTSNLDNLIRVWCRGILLGLTDFATDLAPKILNYLEDYFDIKFPLPKMDLVAVPEFGFSAMENYGMITFRENVLLCNKNASIDEKKKSALVMGHEIAHQWFGNLVTPSTWNDLWLKEGFATYFEYLSVDKAEPSWEVMNDFIQSETSRAFQVDALHSARPISAHLINCRQIRQTFDAISYAKGACLVRMMHDFLGDGVFQDGIRTLLRKYEHGSIDCDRLFGIFEPKELSKEFVKVAMESWTKQAGFPVVNASFDAGSSSLTLTQERFYYSNEEDNEQLWYIPVQLIFDDLDIDEFFWLKERTKTFEISIEDWYLLNLNQTGYYIVNYDLENWQKLIKNIEIFPTLTQLQLIGDSMDLARANQLNYSVPLSLIKKISESQDFKECFENLINEKLSYLRNFLSSTPLHSVLKDFPVIKNHRPALAVCGKICTCEECNFLRTNLSSLIQENSTVRVQDAGSLFAAIAKQNCRLAFNFLRKNWHKMLNRYGDGFSIMARMITCLAAHMNEENDIQEFIEFKNSVENNIGSTSEAFEIAINTIQSNLEWIENNYKSVENWFRENAFL